MTAYTPMKIVGPTTGLVQSREEFILPNDAYPVLENAFVWRERIKRKQGFQTLGRLQRQFTSISLGNSSASPWTFQLLASVGVAGTINGISNFNPGSVSTNEPHNLVTGQKVTITGVSGMIQVNGVSFTITVTGANSFTLGIDTTAYGVYSGGGRWFLTGQPNPQINPGSVVIVMGGVTFTDQGNGTLTSPTPGNSGTINYQTGIVVLTTTVAPGTAATVSFGYFPGLPVMGLRQRDLNSTNNQLTIA